MIYVFCHPAHFLTPSGLGEVARQSLPLGKMLIDPEKLSGEKVFNAGMPCPLPKKNKNYVWCTFETDTIPQEWVEFLNRDYVRIFVPHPYPKQAFESSGITIPVQVVPQGFKRLTRTKPIQKEPSQLKIGIVGYLTGRKNFSKLCEAVRQLNKDGFNVLLHVQATSHSLNILKETMQKHEDSSFIKITYQRNLTDEALAEWYSSLDAYVYPSSGEGWSMTPRESLYMGIPTVVSDISVHDELIKSGYATAIESDGEEAAIYQGDEAWKGRQFGKWQSITVENIKKSLRDVYNNYDEKLKKAQEGAEWIKDKWTWEDALNEIKEVIEKDE